MVIHYLVFRADSLTYTVAKALSHGGHEIAIRMASQPDDSRPLEGFAKRLRQTPRVTFVSRDSAALLFDIDRLIIQAFPRPGEVLAEAAPLISRARKITLITGGDRSRSWRTALGQQWWELRHIGTRIGRIDRVAYKDGFYSRDLLGFLLPRQVVGFDVHSQFLHDMALFEAMHARDWDPNSPRPVLANFLGSQDPRPRKVILDELRSNFRASDGSPVNVKGKSMIWHEYPDSAPVGIPPAEFVKMLTQSDFTLCPRGYSLVTHRPMEALMRGSIPVLASSELDLYGIPLRDGENCVAVPPGGWCETVGRLAEVGDSEILAMRHRIAAMFENELNYGAVSSRIRAAVGVADKVG